MVEEVAAVGGGAAADNEDVGGIGADTTAEAAAEDVDEELEFRADDAGVIGEGGRRGRGSGSVGTGGMIDRPEGEVVLGVIEGIGGGGCAG